MHLTKPNKRWAGGQEGTNPGREGHNDTIAATGGAKAPFLVRDPKALLTGALPSQQLLSGDVALLELAAVEGREEQLPPPVRGVEDEHTSVQGTVRAEEEGDVAVIGSEAEPHRRLVARQRALDDLLHCYGEATAAAATRGATMEAIALSRRLYLRLTFFWLAPSSEPGRFHHRRGGLRPLACQDHCGINRQPTKGLQPAFAWKPRAGAAHARWWRWGRGLRSGGDEAFRVLRVFLFLTTGVRRVATQPNSFFSYIHGVEHR